MRTILVAAIAFCVLTAPAVAAAPKTLAPGINYRQQVRLTAHGPVVVNVIIAPKPGGLYKLVPLLSNEALVGRERLTTMERNISRATTAAAVNGDFSDSSGLPNGILLRSGALESAPLDERSSIGVGNDGTLRIEQVSFFGYWQGSGQQRPLGLNRVNPKNGVTLYTRSYGGSTPAGAGAVGLILSDFPVTTPSVDLSAQVAAIQPGGGASIPANGAVLVGAGEAVEFLRDEAPIGQTLTFRLALTPLWSDVGDALGGGPVLVRQGKPVFDALEEFAPFELGRRQARSAVGQRADGSLVLATIDGGRPGYSNGMTNFELAKTMVRLGAVTASALASGSEATMAFDGKLLSRPSGRRGEIKLTNALAVTYDGVFAPPASERTISPNGDGVAETEFLAYKLVRPSTVTATLTGPDAVARLTDSGPKTPGDYSLSWNGRRSDGSAELEGLWRWSISATDDLGRSSTAVRSFRLNNTLGHLSVKPSLLRLRAKSARRLAIRVKLKRSASTRVRVYSAAGTLVQTVFKGVARKGVLKLSWDGRNGRGRLVHGGRYELRVTASGRLGQVELSRRFRVRRPAK